MKTTRIPFVIGLVAGAIVLSSAMDTAAATASGARMAAKTAVNCAARPGPNVDLSNCTLTHVRFVRANLTGANLTRTALFSANLSGAQLKNANLTGAYLLFANLTGANLAAVTYSNTLCPDGTNSDFNGDTCAGHGGGLQYPNGTSGSQGPHLNEWRDRGSCQCKVAHKRHEAPSPPGDEASLCGSPDAARQRRCPPRERISPPSSARIRRHQSTLA